MMGNRRVTFTQPFYIGIFELTQKQIKLLAGDDNRKFVFAGDMRPADNLSWMEMRGKNDEFDYPKTKEVESNSIIGKLRAKTGLAWIDLPTSYQYGCAWNAGTDGTGRDPLLTGRHYGNRGDGKGGFKARHTSVGSYQPNEWGIYDLHGNVWEMCLDYTGNSAVGADPEGPSEGTKRHLRGGCWNSYNNFIFSEFVPDKNEANNTSGNQGKHGCRIVINAMPDEIKDSERQVKADKQREAARKEQRQQIVDGYTWSYRVNNGEAEIVSWKNGRSDCAVSPKPTGNVTIPSTLGGVKVTRIGQGAFAFCSDLITVTIPDEVKTVGTYAFGKCGGLKFVSIPSSVTVIGNASFCYCSKLESLTIPKNVVSVFEFAFTGCNGLKTIVIPDRVRNIGKRAFYECTGLTSVMMRGERPDAKEEVFGGCTNLKVIHVPANAKSWAGMKEWQGIPLVFDVE